MVFKMRDSVRSGDIPAFVMYCVNGGSGSSLLIESTYSMIRCERVHCCHKIYIVSLKVCFMCTACCCLFQHTHLYKHTHTCTHAHTRTRTHTHTHTPFVNLIQPQDCTWVVCVVPSMWTWRPSPALEGVVQSTPALPFRLRTQLCS